MFALQEEILISLAILTEITGSSNSQDFSTLLSTVATKFLSQMSDEEKLVESFRGQEAVIGNVIYSTNLLRLSTLLRSVEVGYDVVQNSDAPIIAAKAFTEYLVTYNKKQLTS